MSGPVVYNQVSYGLNQPLNTGAPVPIIAKRAPTTKDINYPLCTLWDNKPSNAIYVLASVASGSATWLLLESGGGSGTFSSLTVTPGPINLTGVTTVLGTTNINATGAAATNVGTGTGALTIGNVTSGTGVVGNLGITGGNLNITTAGAYLALPGPIYIYSGAGAPASGLAVHVGDLYLNTTAASATTRLYIATAASTWTNVTCAA